MKIIVVLIVVMASNLAVACPNNIQSNGDTDTSRFTGTSCRANPKTGDRRCCSYENGRLTSCWSE